MFKLLRLLLSGENKEKSLVGGLLGDIRELIKGKEIDPQEALKLVHELNRAEAQHRSIFVAGWRPFIGWIGGLILFFNYIAVPILTWVLPETNPPILDLDALWPVITGMLGIAGMRSYDKMKGNDKS